MPPRWIESFVVAVVVCGWTAIHYRWPGSRRLVAGLRAARAWGGANPATAMLWILVALHVWVLAGLPGKLGQSVLRVHSTNLTELRRDPVTVLFASAIWTDVGDLLTLTVTALLILGPAERWLGTARGIMVFLAGHIGATLLTAVWLNYQISHGELRRSVAHTVDVGVSYGTWCTAAVLCYRLSWRWRIPAFAALGGWFVLRYVQSGTFTDLGHCIAITIGVLLYPLTRAASVRERASGRWIKVPVFPAADGEKTEAAEDAPGRTADAEAVRPRPTPGTRSRPAGPAGSPAGSRGRSVDR